MASEQHGRHKFQEITEIYNTNKDVIRNDKNEFENKISPAYEEIVVDLENQLANFDGIYEKYTTNISKQGEKWHKEIDIIITEMKTKLCDMKVSRRKILQEHLDEIKQKQSLISQTLFDLGELEKSTEVSPIVEYSSKISKFSYIPPKFQLTVSLPMFIPNPIDHKKLYLLF